MFRDLPEFAPDAILKLITQFRLDPRASKIDLGVGVYRDTSGQTPVMRAVKEAEVRLWHAQQSKGYLDLRGDAEMLGLWGNMVFGPQLMDRFAASQAPGGTGALSALFRMANMARPGCRFWLPDQGWPNHAAILAYLGYSVRKYRYFDPATGAADLGAMMTDLDMAEPGDVVLLHGCCHNPTGADLVFSDWIALSEQALVKGWVPLIDLAYHGMGDGLTEDVAGLRYMAGAVPEMMLAVSASKTFGLYRDRAGAAMVITDGQANVGRVNAALAAINRLSYSFAPDHGGAIVGRILAEADLFEDWAAELETMRTRLLVLRQSLSAALGPGFEPLAAQKGLFSQLGLTPAQVTHLREDHGIYMTDDSRINIAGLNADNIAPLAAAIRGLR